MGRNEFVVILGPGQCGKTTLLRMIAGFEKPSVGRVLMDGREIEGPGHDKGFVFQSYMLFAWRTVRGNVEVGPRVRNLSREERRRLSQQYIDMVGLNGFEEHYPHQLSGGMKQRVGIARAYCNCPEIMLLDEPFGQLDAQTRLFMEKETERIWMQEKRTVVFVTNNIDEALTLGDRIYTDIACGVNAGIDAVFLLSGEGVMADIEKYNVHPSYVFRNIRAFLTELEKGEAV